MTRYINLEEQVDRDFTHARQRAFLRRVTARLRESLVCNRLPSFDEVKGPLGAFSQVYLGMRIVPVEKIVGSLNRYRDFDRAFLPTRAGLEERWKRIGRAYHRTEGLPSVSLYKIGESYFVVDGNHRVSVARYQGVEMLDVEVIAIRSQVPTGHVLERECKET